MEDKDTYDLIEAYLQGKLNSDEALRFEDELKINSDLNDELQFHKLSNDVFVEQRIQNVRKVINERKKGGSNSRSIYLGLISVLILCGTYYFLKPFYTNTLIISTNDKNDITLVKDEISQSQGVLLINKDASIVSGKVEKKVDVSKSKSIDLPKKQSIITAKQNEFSDEKGVYRVVDSLSEKPLVKKSDYKEISQITPAQQMKEEPLIHKDSNILSDEGHQTPDITIDNEGGINELINDYQPPINKRVNLEVSPEYNEFDTFPFENSESGILQIFSKKGELVQVITIQDGEPSFWNGKDKNGNITPGYYIYKFESSSLILAGGITVIY